MLRYSQIKVQPLANHRYKVLRPVIYKDVIIHKGYRTNGADVPRILWWYIPPNDSQLLPAVILHDYLCDKGMYDKADSYLRSAMKDLKVPTFKRCTVYYAVRGYSLFIRPIIKGIA